MCIAATAASFIQIIYSMHFVIQVKKKKNTRAEIIIIIFFRRLFRVCVCVQAVWFSTNTNTNHTGKERKKKSLRNTRSLATSEFVSHSLYAIVLSRRLHSSRFLIDVFSIFSFSLYLSIEPEQQRGVCRFAEDSINIRVYRLWPYYDHSHLNIQV